MDVPEGTGAAGQAQGGVQDGASTAGAGREKASSNICSNQALCALTASVYMTAMGADGMEEAARQCMSKAHYLRDRPRCPRARW